jgi:hypothetical protein
MPDVYQSGRALVRREQPAKVHRLLYIVRTINGGSILMYYVKLDDGCLSHRGRTEWCRSQAYKHAREYRELWGKPCRVLEV